MRRGLDFPALTREALFIIILLNHGATFTKRIGRRFDIYWQRELLRIPQWQAENLTYAGE